MRLIKNFEKNKTTNIKTFIQKITQNNEENINFAHTSSNQKWIQLFFYYTFF
jgi:hypothetical protein